VAVLIEPPASLPLTTPTGSIIYTCYIDEGSGDDEICSINADGSNQQQLTFNRNVSWMASFTAGLTNILFSSATPGKFTIFEADADGQNAYPISIPSYADYSPMASPDNELIAFTRAESGDHIYQNIWVMNRDGTGAHPITSIVGNAISPSWSPDGSQIAYSQKLDGEHGYSLWIMNADGTEGRKLPIPLRWVGERADWSPNGQWLVFYAGVPGEYEIYIVAVDGSVYYQVTDGGVNVWPSFSPDGNWVVFTSDRDGDNDLYLIRLDGKFLTSLTINDTSDWQPRWGR
jgi:Tol biopolymer transport system component